MVVGYGSAYRPSKRRFHGPRGVPTGSQQFVHFDEGARGCVNLRPRDSQAPMSQLESQDHGKMGPNRRAGCSSPPD